MFKHTGKAGEDKIVDATIAINLEETKNAFLYWKTAKEILSQHDLLKKTG